MIQVYHAKEPTFFVRDGFVPNVMQDFAHVANVYDNGASNTDTESLDRAYQLTNSIHCAWTDNDKDVAFLGSPDHGMEGCRSTSVGDVLVREENGVFVTYLVVSCGFRRVEVK
jgi:hypothetical protein